ncbi:MAG: TonB-dependent receptor, partial [Pseudomonadales bacterium]
DDFQFSRLDVSISPTTLTFNIGQAKSDGLEADMSFMLTDNWTLNAAASYINAELSEDYFISATDATPAATSGTRLPRVPEFKGNLSTRYHFENDWYLQAAYIYTGSSFNNLFDGGAVNTRLRKQDSYQIVNLATGIARDSWRAELYVRNATDERGDVFRNAVSYGERVTVNRPRTIGMRIGYDF